MSTTQTTLTDNTNNDSTEPLTALPGIGEQTANDFGLATIDTPAELKAALQNDDQAHRLQNIQTQYIKPLLEALDLELTDTGPSVIAVAHGWRFHRDKHGAILRRHRDIPGYQITNHASTWGDEKYCFLQSYRDQKWGWCHVSPKSSEISLEAWDKLLGALEENANDWTAPHPDQTQERIESFLDSL